MWLTVGFTALFVVGSFAWIGDWLDGGVAWAARALVLVDVAGAILLISKPTWMGVAAVIAVHAALGGVCLTSDPVIDVRMFQEVGAEALIAGENPYTETYPDVYVLAGRPELSEFFYGEGVSEGGTLTYRFPYLPGSALVVVPGRLAGDVRYVHLAASLIAGWLLARNAKDLQMGAVGATVVMLNPSFLAMIAFAWTEPILAALVIGAAASRKSWRFWSGTAVLFKQNMVFFSPLFWILESEGKKSRVCIRELVIGALPLGLITLWFAISDFAAFYRPVFEWQFVQPFRPDSISALTARVNSYSWPPEWSWPLITFGLGGVALIISLRKLPHSRSNFGVAVSMVALWFFLSAKQSFVNYLLLAFVGLGIAVAFSGDDPDPLGGSKRVSTTTN